MRRRPSPPLAARLARVLLVGVVAACAAPVDAESEPTTAALPTDAPATPLADATPLAVPTPPIAASPAPASVAVRPTERYALDLYRRGDFVGQYTFEWCVGASIQMAQNIVRPVDDRTRGRQQRLWERARDLSSSPFGGANPIGWTAVLNEAGIGRYELISVPDLATAVRTAALAIRTTKRPVGLVMWRGRHAWVMSGFTSLGDPARTDAFEVTGVRVLDPLYPHGSTVWGPSPRPNALLTLEQLGRQYVPRLSGRVNLGVPPGYLLIVPRG